MTACAASIVGLCCGPNRFVDCHGSRKDRQSTAAAVWDGGLPNGDAAPQQNPLAVFSPLELAARAKKSDAADQWPARETGTIAPSIMRTIRVDRRIDDAR